MSVIVMEWKTCVQAPTIHLLASGSVTSYLLSRFHAPSAYSPSSLLRVGKITLKALLFPGTIHYNVHHRSMYSVIFQNWWKWFIFIDSHTMHKMENVWFYTSPSYFHLFVNLIYCELCYISLFWSLCLNIIVAFV